MYQHNTLVAGFIPVNDAEVESVISSTLDEIAAELSTESKKVLGEDVRKMGYVKENADRLTQALKKAGKPVIYKFTGPLLGVGYVVNKDARGNIFPKMRVQLGKDLFSLDLAGEYAQRLAAKLEGVLVDQVESVISFSSFCEVVDRGGRKYVNHIASVKDDRGSEIRAVADHFKTVQDQVNAATASIRSASAKAEERKAIKTEHFAALVQELEALRPIPEVQKEEPRDASPTTAPAHVREKLAAMTQRAAPAQRVAPRVPARAAA